MQTFRGVALTHVALLTSYFGVAMCLEHWAGQFEILLSLLDKYDKIVVVCFPPARPPAELKHIHKRRKRK